MIGAIAGDIIGCPYEFDNIKTEDFPLFNDRSDFTDDTILTIATAEVLLEGRSYEEAYRDWGLRYPNRGFGGNFSHWLSNREMGSYNSWGNGSAMRVSPVGFALESIEKVLEEAERSATVTHNHPEGIKGAQSTAAAVFLALNGRSKEEIKKYINETFGYDLDFTLDEIRPGYSFDVSCQGTMPVALVAFFESSDFEDSIRKAVSVGGDSDTIACITGGIAQAFYGGLAKELESSVKKYLPDDMLDIIKRFEDKYF